MIPLITTSNDTNTTIEPLTSISNILWSRLSNYTCNNFIPAIGIFYNISQTECESICLSANYSMQCTAVVWYAYVKPIENDVPRCYLFGQSCDLIKETLKPVVTSFWYKNITENINCVNYPSNWKDAYLDDCHIYSKYNWCQQAYNSSTTTILSYQDRFYGLNALKVCCECNGGLYNYDSIYFIEPKWKPTSKLNIYDDTNYNDFICDTVDFSVSLFNEIDILKHDRFDFIEFVGLCQHLHASLYSKYKLLLSISAENNDIMNAKNIDSDFNKFKQFDCVNNLLLNEVTICNNTDENNLYPFIIDLEEDHIYINNHYINSETFIYHLPPTHIHIQSFCSFSMLLNTTFPTKPPTKEPTFEPTMEPTIVPTDVPTTNPTQITSNPTALPTNAPTYEPTFEPTTVPTSVPTFFPTFFPTFHPTSDPTKDPTFVPTFQPTFEPTIEPTNNPTNVPSNNPTQVTMNPTHNPTTEPTLEPVFRRRRLLNHYYSTPYFKTNIIAAFLCQTGYTESPTISPTKYPSIPPTQNIIETVSYDTTLEIDDSSSEKDTKTLSGGAIAGIVIGVLAFCILIAALIYLFGIKKRTAPKEVVNVISPSVERVQTEQIEQTEQKNDGMLEMQTVPVPQYESEMNYSWKRKRMRSWTNEEILDWIRCMNLGADWNVIISNVIEMNGIMGEDIVELKSFDDVGEAFDITENKILCKKIFKQIKNFKPNLKGDNDRFRINIFVGNEHLTLDEEVGKTDTIKKIKTMYKIQEMIDFELNHIHFRYKKKELLDNKTLQQCGIKNEKHLIEIELDNVFPIYIFAQGTNLTLNQKVTKDYKIQQIKEMYKSQSGVLANVQDIQFYKKKKLLESNKTLAQCGIVDDKHLITVKFETDGGGELN